MIPENISRQAARCLGCKNAPCSKNCPLGIDIPSFIGLMKEDKLSEAFNEVFSASIFGEVCSAVCPLDKHCRSSCVRGLKGDPVEIPMLENYLFERYFNPSCAQPVSETSGTVAVVGSGVAGISCAVALAQQGVKVTVFEMQDNLGGITANEIPSFRLERRAFSKVIEYAKNLGVSFINNSFLSGEDVRNLTTQFDAVFLACGLQKDVEVAVSNLDGVVSATQYLRGNRPKSVKTVVVGGGNVAMDCARTALRNGAEVIVAYRRTEEDMPAFREERLSALREGVRFMCLLSPFSVNGEGRVQSATFAAMQVTGVENNRSRIEQTNNLVTIDCDCVIMALGSRADSEFFRNAGISLINGRVEVDDNLMTSIDGLFAGGDIIAGENTVAKAVSDGRNAATSIIKYINK